MRLADFRFDLPEDLIAKYPLDKRSASRLLHLDRRTGRIVHRRFEDLVECLTAEDLVVFNDTRVIKARLRGHKATGGRVEVLVERIEGRDQAIAHIRASRAPQPGSELLIGDATVSVEGRDGELFILRFSSPVHALLDSHGHVPLPPYIDRADDATDASRYQTVYARHDGAVAAPTAGLHFDEELLGRLDDKGIDQGFLTLHVGAGTFQPVRTEDVEDHVMHEESVEVTDELCRQVAACRERGGRLVAIGTTTLRALESAAVRGEVRPLSGDTSLYVYPGYEFQCVDALVTNFHLPGSTLILLVSAFAGWDRIRASYQAAIDERYRFYSYGDAMFIE